MPPSPSSRSDRGSVWAEALITACGWATSAVVLIIVIFLFSEGSSLFFQTPVERSLKAAVHPDNPVHTLSDREIQALVYGEIDNWKPLGGKDQPIQIYGIHNLEKVLRKTRPQAGKPEDYFGADYRGLPAFLDSLLQAQPGGLLIFQQKYLPPAARPLELGTISLSHFLGGTRWMPAESPVPLFGVLPLLWGSLLVTLGALFFALLLGPPVAIYLAELANERVRSIIKPMIELLAGIPSVVFGFIGLVVLVPQIQQTFSLSSGSTALAGSILLAIIALPTIISVIEDALRATPHALKEASLALGATHWQTIYTVILPHARPGIIAAVLLGVGRIVGETMAVLMVTGNNPQMVGFEFLESVRTMSAAIAAEMGEAPQGGIHYKSLFAVGCVLFILTFGINLIGEVIKYAQRKY